MKMSVLKSPCRLNEIHIKVPAEPYSLKKNVILKFMLKSKGTRITNFEKEIIQLKILYNLSNQNCGIGGRIDTQPRTVPLYS